MPNLKRSIQIKFRVTETERDLIDEKMAAANISNREAYLRKMSLDGYVVNLDLTDVRRMVQLLTITSNNINQIARRANETGSVYIGDIRYLHAQYDLLWNQADAILRSLANIQR